MKRMLRWGLAWLTILAMALVFAGGCAPAEDVGEIDDADFEEWDEEGFIEDIDFDFEEGLENGEDVESDLDAEMEDQNVEE